MSFKLEEVIYDSKARDGTYCTLPYVNHPKGCPNYPNCPEIKVDFKLFGDKYSWYAIIEEFDLKSHAEKMKKLHPTWTERQCRNLLYWQNGVRSRLRLKAHNWLFNNFKGGENDGIVLEVPEACGVNIFETMSRAGIIIERNPQIVRKVMLVGVRKNGSL